MLARPAGLLEGGMENFSSDCDGLGLSMICQGCGVDRGSASGRTKYE